MAEAKLITPIVVPRAISGTQIPDRKPKERKSSRAVGSSTWIACSSSSMTG
jgi:hypothetical protein